MAAYNDRVPLKDGTVLRTADGKCFHILHSTSVGGSAILYSAHLDGSSLDVTLKEFYPAGCVRVNGVALNPDLAAPDVSPALRQAFYQRLERMAQHELELSQLVYNGSFHALPHLEQLEVCSISQPEEPVHRSADGTALPCTFLYLPTLNPSKGFFLSDLLAECAAYPQSEEHPFGALTPDEPRSIAAPHVLTTLHLIRLILDALATLHKTALHGDISLGNLFIDGDLHTGTLRGAVFLDFGSARLLDAPNGKTAPILPSEKLYTTPLFCAPEIFTGVRSGEPFCLTPAADVYSVGVLLRLLLRKEALAAYRKFPEDLAEELKPAEIYPSDTVPSARPVLPQLNRILSAAAEPDPEKRISAAEMLKEINDLIEQLSAPRFPLAENLSSPETFIPHSRDNELKAIRKQMDSGVHPIFLYGLGGLGKTETARALLRQCKTDGMHVAFFNYEQSVRDTILNLEFTNYKYTPSKPSLTLEQQEEEQYHEKLMLLAAMGQNSVVVMDNFDSSSRTFDDLRSEPAYQDLIALGGPHLIITTRFTPKGNPPVEIRPLPKEMLLKMMLNIMDEKDDSPSVDTLLNIIEAVQGHTLTCYLIGNALSDPLGDLTAQDVLDALKQYDLHSLTEDVTSDKDRKYTRETIYGHLKILFNMCGMTGAYRAALCHTLLLPQKGLDVKLFRQGESKEEQNALKSLIAHGWVQCTCSTENIHLLTIHPLIRDLILNEMKPQEKDIVSYSNRLWERYDPWDFTTEELRLRITLLENALEFFQPGLEWAELHYRLGILWLSLGGNISPCKAELALVARTSKILYHGKESHAGITEDQNGANHLKAAEDWAWNQRQLHEQIDYKKTARYTSSICSENPMNENFTDDFFIRYVGGAVCWKANSRSTDLLNSGILPFLRVINGCQEKADNDGSFSTFLNEISNLIAQNESATENQKFLLNNLASVCIHAARYLAEEIHVVRCSIYYYTPSEIREKTTDYQSMRISFETLGSRLLKMAESRNSLLQIAINENRGKLCSEKGSESEARQYYRKACALIEKQACREETPWIAYMYSCIGYSYRRQFKTTRNLNDIERALQTFQDIYRLCPNLEYNQVIVSCMFDRAKYLSEKDPQAGLKEAEKILVYWEPFVENSRKSDNTELYEKMCEEAVDICLEISNYAINIQKVKAFYLKRSIDFLDRVIKLEDSKVWNKKEQGERHIRLFFLYENKKNICERIFQCTGAAEDRDKWFDSWKIHLDFENTPSGIWGMDELIHTLETYGYHADAEHYRKIENEYIEELMEDSIEIDDELSDFD